MEGSLRILIVEDDSPLAMGLADAVRAVRPGSVECVKTLAEGTERARKEVFSLVFIAVVVADPRMGGVAEVRARFTAPVVFTLPHPRLAGPLALEAWEWVAAPFSVPDVARVLNFTLRLHASEMRLQQVRKKLHQEEALADLGRSAARAGGDFGRILEEIDAVMRELQVNSIPSQGPALLRLEQALRRGQRVAGQVHSAPPTRPSGESSLRVQVNPPRRQTVLVVDDDESIRELASCVIKQMGWNAVTARDGEEAFLRFQTDPGQFQVVLLDLSLPRLSGVEVVAGIRALRPTMPVVMITGHGEDSLAHDGRLALSGLLHKPFSPDALRAVLHRALHTESPSLQGAGLPA